MTSNALSDVKRPTMTQFVDDVTFINNASNTSELAHTTSMTPGVTQSIYGKYGPVEAFPQFWVAYYINKYYLTVISAVGFPGNFLSLITILKMKPRSHPSIYVAVLAVTDNLCLAAKMFFIELTRHDVDVGDIGCNLLYFTGNLTAVYANWLLVMMTVERFLAIWMPLKVGTLCTRQRSAMALALLLLAVMSLASAVFVFSESSWAGNDFRCTYKQEYLEFVEFVWYWIDGVLYALLPCVLLIVFNTLIILGIKRAANIQRQLTEDSNCRNKQVKGQAMEQLRQQRQITVMLVVISVVFVLLTIPNCIFFIYKPYWKVERSAYRDYANYKCIEQIVYFLSDASHAINFFVYFISTKKFRDRFLDLVCCCRKWKRRIARTSHVGQSQLSDTGSIYITSTSHSGVIPLSLRSSGKY
ncbi:rhodopsin-like [Babylonia areolata]|uniref:rhodopsin-like n=1 Tax=Babylonia areolata TaxID=304850 RepID=UPI003FD3288A